MFWQIIAVKEYPSNNSADLEYYTYVPIAQGSGTSVTFNNQIFNLTIDAELNSEGEIIGATVLIINENTGQVIADKSFSLPNPIPDTQVSLETELPAIVSSNGTLEESPPPIIPSNNYLFVNGAYEQYWIIYCLPYTYAVQYDMVYKNSLVGIPTYTNVSQGFEYLW